MARLIILAEGATEREFIQSILLPHLQNYGLWVNNPPDLGGNVSLARLRSTLLPLLHNYDYVTTLIDYYGFKRDAQQAWSSVEALERCIEQLFPHLGHLIPYVQQYEFEALLFSGPKQIAQVLRRPEKLDDLFAIPAAFNTPEEINNSPETCPSARLRGLFGRAYNKVQHGPEIAQQIGLETMRAHCPRFDAWVSRLERLRGNTDVTL